jgi:hypothetical protein
LTPPRNGGNVCDVRNNPNGKDHTMTTTTLQLSDYCQGHGGGRDCPYDPEYGCLNHEIDCGVTSYCDGTCDSAREAYRDHLERGGLPEPLSASPDALTLAVGGYGATPASYVVTFEGPDAGAWALAYIAARPGIYFSELPELPSPLAAFPELAEVLYPTCHHGLDARLCMDPVGDGHFGTLEQELANGW